MADRKEIARAHMRSLAEFYRNFSVGLFITFSVALLAGDLVGWLDRFGDLSILGLAALTLLFYSQRLVERSYE